ncbi:MAG: DUF2934 domain-containing protein [Planctomycetota bacterium]
MAKITQTVIVKNPVRTSGAQNLAEQIKRRAYELYQKKGQTHGNDMADWLEAERDIKFKLKYKV